MPKMYKEGQVCEAEDEQVKAMKEGGWSKKKTEEKPLSAAEKKKAEKEAKKAAESGVDFEDDIV